MELLKLLESIRGDIFTSVNLIFSKFGEEMVLFAILCLVYWCISKKLGYQIAFSYLISGFVVNTIKVTAKIQRPFVRDTSLKPVDKAIKHATGYSFPSVHTQSATSVYGSLSLKLGSYNIGLGILFFLPILCVAFSRMYLGVHTPYDVGVAFTVSLLITGIVSYLFNNYMLDPSHYRVVLIVFTILGFALMIVSACEMVYGGVSIENGLDCFKAGSAIIGFIFGWYIEITKIKFNEKGISIPLQMAKYVCGMAGLFVLYVGTAKLLLIFLDENNFAVNIVPYLLSSFWVTGGYPFIIKKWFSSPFSYGH